MSGGGGGGGQIQETRPWAGLQPYLTRGYEQAGNFLNQSPWSYYPGSTVAQFTPYQNQGIDLASQFAQNTLPGISDNANSTALSLLGRNGITGALNPALNPAANTLISQMNPQMNPYLDSMASHAVGQAKLGFDSAINQVRDEMIGAGQNIGDTSYLRGLDMASRNFGNSVNNITTDIYGNAYNTDMARAQNAANSALGMFNSGYGTNSQVQLGALGALPSVANLGLMPSQIYSNIGGQQQAQNQAQLTDLVNAYNFNQQAPYQQIQNYMNLLAGSPQVGTSSTTTQTQPQSNPLLGAGGGALMGMALTPAGASMLPYVLGGGALGFLGSR